MRIDFNNSKDFEKFYNKVQATKEITIDGEKFRVSSMGGRVNASHYRQYELELDLSHQPKRVDPTWEYGEDQLKLLRQQNSSLLKYTEKAIAMFVMNGGAEKYLAKYNRDGTEK